MTICPGCGQWHDGLGRVNLCRDCWLNSTDDAYARAVESFKTWYKGFYGEAAYHEMRAREERGK